MITVDRSTAREGVLRLGLDPFKGHFGSKKYRNVEIQAHFQFFCKYRNFGKTNLYLAFFFPCVKWDPYLGISCQKLEKRPIRVAHPRMS